MSRTYARWALAAAMTATLALAGCASGARSMADENYESVSSKIVKGKTTKEEVRAMFGKPNHIGREGNSEMWAYTYARSNGKAFIPVAGAFMSNTVSAKTLTIMFNNRGVVRDYGMSEGSN